MLATPWLCTHMPYPCNMNLIQALICSLSLTQGLPLRRCLLWGTHNPRNLRSSKTNRLSLASCAAASWMSMHSQGQHLAHLPSQTIHAMRDTTLLRLRWRRYPCYPLRQALKNNICLRHPSHAVRLRSRHRAPTAICFCCSHAVVASHTKRSNAGAVSQKQNQPCEVESESFSNRSTNGSGNRNGIRTT